MTTVPVPIIIIEPRLRYWTWHKITIQLWAKGLRLESVHIPEINVSSTPLSALVFPYRLARHCAEESKTRKIESNYMTYLQVAYTSLIQGPVGGHITHHEIEHKHVYVRFVIEGTKLQLYKLEQKLTLPLFLPLQQVAGPCGRRLLVQRIQTAFQRVSVNDQLGKKSLVFVLCAAISSASFCQIVDQWWSMMIDDDRWWSMMIDDDRWWSMMIDDDRWWTTWLFLLELQPCLGRTSIVDRILLDVTRNHHSPTPLYRSTPACRFDDSAVQCHLCMILLETLAPAILCRHPAFPVSLQRWSCWCGSARCWISRGF